MKDNLDYKRLTLILAFGVMVFISANINTITLIVKPYYQAIRNYVGGQLNNFNADAENNDYQSKAPKTTVSYNSAQAQLLQERQLLASAYKKASSASEKKVIIDEARVSFVASITTLLPYWYGTPWDFNGISQTPQQGSIACGYYVSTVLRDSGLDVERAKLAQQASENIIKSLTDDTHIKRFSNQSLADFLAVVDEWGAGLYVVGLDFHVGYLWHDGEQMRFIHATALPPSRAISEPAETSPALNNSRYRVIGKISADDELIKKWLLQSDITTKT